MNEKITIGDWELNWEYSGTGWIYTGHSGQIRAIKTDDTSETILYVDQSGKITGGEHSFSQTATDSWYASDARRYLISLSALTK